MRCRFAPGTTPEPAAPLMLLAGIVQVAPPSPETLIQTVCGAPLGSVRCSGRNSGDDG
jgi:hypothetical protein